MALKSTVYKVQLNLSDMDTDRYTDHAFTLALHPSETLERLLVRIIAFAWFADEALVATRGLSSEDEPDLWQKDLTDTILHWIEVGMPDETRIRKGCHRAARMTVFTYGDYAAPVWWDKIRPSLTRFENLEVIFLPQAPLEALTPHMGRNLSLQITRQDGVLWITLDTHTVELKPEIWRQAR